MSGTGPTTLLIDTHVHIRACFPKERYLDTAGRNFAAAAARLGRSEWVGVLMLTESHTEDVFRALQRQAGEPGAPVELPGWGGWRIAATDDGRSLWLDKQDAKILLIAGQQIDTAEGLEVSVLGAVQPIPDHTPIEGVLATAEQRDTVSVIPWAPGKWFFGRGKRLSAMMQRRPDGGFYLGDNGGRPWLWPLPTHLRRARARGIPILPGSDPLPFVSEMERTGSFGIVIEAELDLRRPATALIELLRDPANLGRPYGRLANPVAFFWKEFTMQLTKRKRKRMAAVGLDS